MEKESIPLFWGDHVAFHPETGIRGGSFPRSDLDFHILFPRFDPLENHKVVRPGEEQSGIGMFKGVGIPFQDKGRRHHGFSCQAVIIQDGAGSGACLQGHGAGKGFPGCCGCGIIPSGCCSREGAAHDNLHRSPGGDLPDQALSSGLKGDQAHPPPGKFPFKGGAYHAPFPGAPVDGDEPALRVVLGLLFGGFVEDLIGHGIVGLALVARSCRYGRE